MGDIAIQVKDVSKLYQLGTINTGTLSRDLEKWWARVRGKEDPFLKIGQTNDRSKKAESDYVWSLKDINFEIKKGDTVGIIGKNGAGKSTLLKILSRVTSPTTGEINLSGRVASLLEVGTGFHPELTGRENIFLNGAILGMTKNEIKRKLDEIIDFSGVEMYIDTPVKRYSSGMYVRLAFAVAAYLESEILIVDEVLAVGDAEFQKKCLGKMGEVSSKEGRTVLFVSHNMNAISNLTNRSILLENGLITSNGLTLEVVNRYMKINSILGNTYFSKKENGNYISKVKINTSETGNLQLHNKPLNLEIDINVDRKLNNGGLAFQFINLNEVPVVHFWIFFNQDNLLFNKEGNYNLICNIPICRLYKGTYMVNLFLSENFGTILIENLQEVCKFDVEMFNIPREYPWDENSSTYLDDFSWEIKRK